MMDRRTFLQNAAGALAASAAGTETYSAALPPTKPGKMIGIQLGAVSLLDEGTDKVLEECQRDAFVDTLFVATFKYGRGDRRSPGAWPAAAGPRQAAVRHRHLCGWLLHEVRPQILSKHHAQEVRAPELGDYDVLDDLIPKAKKHGMQTIARFEDVVKLV